MPRDIPVSIENSWDNQQSLDAVSIFVTIQHVRLTEPLRVVSSATGDNVGNHILNNALYLGIPFNCVIVTDDDRPPRGRIELLNYNLEVGRAVIAMRTRPRITIEKYAARDFTEELSATATGIGIFSTSSSIPAHKPIGTPRLLYRATWMTLVNVKGSTWITGDLVHYGPDLSVEPASPIRATQDRFPCLFK